MIKDDFPYFSNSKITYLDNGATTQKPQRVIDSVVKYYSEYCANTHRGSYKDGNLATLNYEDTRDFVRSFINANSSREIIFTKGVTEGINMVASSFVKENFKTVIISSLEHHSNIVPWHNLGYKKGNGLEVVRFNNNLEFDLSHFEELLKKNPGAFVSVTHVSNVFGIVHPIKKITELTHKYGGKVLIDGAQSLSRINIDVKEIDADFFVFSSHKSYGPTGVGVLYIKESNIKSFKLYQTGGAVIDRVTYDDSTFLDSPLCFEAGTQNIAGVIGFKSALEYIKSISYEVIQKHEKYLLELLHKGLGEIDDVLLYTHSNLVGGNLSFNIKDITPIDLGLLLDKQGVAVRAGHHCAMPIMEELGIDGTVRVSLGIYNDKEDIENFLAKLKRAVSILKD